MKAKVVKKGTGTPIGKVRVVKAVSGFKPRNSVFKAPKLATAKKKNFKA